MNAILYPVSSVNAQQTTLAGTIGSGDSTIAVNSVTNLNTAGGVLCIARQDGNGNPTPTLREYIIYTSISGNNLIGVTRGVAGSTAQAHNSGAIVEELITVSHWGGMIDFLQAEHDSGGRHVISTATINYTETKRLAVTSIASIARIESGSIALISGLSVPVASIVNLSLTTLTYPTPTQVPWNFSGALVTVLVGNASLKFPMIRATRNWTITDVFMSVLSAPSTGVLTVDINYLSTPTATPASIFSTKPTIDVGEVESITAATPAIITLTSLASGNYLYPEIETPNGAGDLYISVIAKERP